MAKDGADLGPASVTTETYHVEYQASTPQVLALEIYLPGPKFRVTRYSEVVPDGLAAPTLRGAEGDRRSLTPWVVRRT